MMTAPLSTALPASMRNCFLARQPVFDPKRQVYGYEILFYRNGQDFPTHDHDDSDEAATRALSDTLSVFGLKHLAEGRKAFFQLTRQALLQGHAQLLPRGQAVIAIHNAESDQELVETCRQVKKDGYQLAMEHCLTGKELVSMFDLADIIKVNFRATPPEECRAQANRFTASGKHLLAEKVETWQEFQDALSWGYRYFQGPFFCRPELVAAKELPPSRLAVTRLMAELNRPRVDMNSIEETIKQDPPLALKMLAYLNSAFFGRRYQVTSIRRAIVVLGLTNLRRWVGLFAVANLAEKRPPELFRACLIRARFCELIGAQAGMSQIEFDLFLVGLLSCIDAILGRPLAELLQNLAVSDNVRDALTGVDSPLGQIYALVRAYEAGDWDSVKGLAVVAGLQSDQIAEAYLQSLSWAAETCGQATIAGR